MVERYKSRRTPGVFISCTVAQPGITVDPRMSFSDTVAPRVGAYRFEFFEVRVLILIES